MAHGTPAAVAAAGRGDKGLAPPSVMPRESGASSNHYRNGLILIAAEYWIARFRGR
jgi:hypothetical protein